MRTITMARNFGNLVVHFINNYVTAKQYKQLTVHAMIKRWPRIKRGCRSEIISPVKVIVVIIL